MSDTSTADVTVVIPLYNAANYVLEAIQSVRRQTWARWEAVVVDDGSTDGSAELVRHEQDSRIRLIEQPNQGASAARNTGVAAAATPWIALLDADDLWLPHKLESQLAVAEAHGADLVFGPVELFGAAHRPRSYRSRPYLVEGRTGLARMISRNHVPLSTTLFRRELFVRLGGFDESMPVVEDYDLWMRMLLAGARMVYDPRATARYRLLETGLSANKARMKEGMSQVLRRLSLPSVSLNVRRQLKLWELYWSRQRRLRAA